MTRVRRVAVLAAVLGACSGDDTAKPEIVVADAGATPQLLGATATTVFWSASGGGMATLVSGASIASLPAQGAQLASAVGPVAAAGDHVIFVTDRATISLVDATGTVQSVTGGTPDIVAGSSAEMPVVAWTVGAMVSWGVDAVQRTVTLNKVVSCDNARVTSEHIYVAVDDPNGRRLLRIEQRNGNITPITSSVTWAPMFPGGGTAGSTYKGRIVGADDDAALWLVEEMPSRRAILVREPLVGEPSVLLQHIAGASGFFVAPDALYWQEGDALLTAPRAGGDADIAATGIGTAGAYADGYIYFTSGVAIERVRVK